MERDIVSNSEFNLLILNNVFLSIIINEIKWREYADEPQESQLFKIT